MAVLGQIGITCPGTTMTITTPFVLDGFEHGVTGAASINGAGLWSAQSTPANWSITTSNPRGGGSYGQRSIRFTTTAGTAFVRWAPSNLTVLVVRFGIYFTSMPTGTPTLFQFFQNTNTDCFFRYNATTGKFNFGASPFVASTVTPTTGQWYTIDLRIDLRNNPNLYDWSIDGVAQTGQSVSQAADSCWQIHLGPGTSTTADWQVDDLVITSTIGDYPIGDSYIVPLVPSGVGTHSFTAGDFDYTTNSGGAFTPVVVSPSTDVSAILGQIPMSGVVSYVRQDVIRTTGYLEHPFADLPANATTVNAARGFVGYKSTATTANEGATGAWRSSDSTFLDIYGNPTTRADMSETSVFYKSANLALNGTTPAEVNGLTCRIGYSGDVTPNPQWCSVMLQVDVTVSTGTLFTENKAGALTPAGAITSTKTSLKSLAGALSPAGAHARIKLAAKALGGALTPAGLLARVTLKILAGALSPSAAIVRLKSIPKALTASLSPAGAAVRATSAVRAGALSPTATLARVKVATRSFAGSMSPAAALVRVKLAARSFSGVLSPTAAITYFKVITRAFSGSLSPTATLVQIKTATRAFSGALSPTATLVQIKTAVRALAGALNPTGVILSGQAYVIELLGRLYLNDEGAGVQNGPPNFIIPLYEYPSFFGSSWDDLVANPVNNDFQHSMVIANPATGPGASFNSDWEAAITASRFAGGQLVLGYIVVNNFPTDTDVRDIADVEADMADWLSFYNIDGFFFDLTPTGALGDRKSYMVDLQESAYAAFDAVDMPAAPYLVANPGTWPLEQEYLDPMTVTVVHEGAFSGYTSVTVPGYASGYASSNPPLKLAHIIHDAPTDADMVAAFRHSLDQGVGWFYATDASNYELLATYWADEVNAQAPHSPALKPLLGKAGTLTSAGVAARLISTLRAGTLSPAGALAKAIARTKALAGSLSPSATLVKVTSLLKAGALTLAGTLTAAGAQQMNLSGALSPAGALAQIVARSRSLQASLTSAGVARRLVATARAGALSPSATIAMARLRTQALSGALSPTATIVKVKQVARALSGALSPAGAATRLAALVKSGSITFTGAIQLFGGAGMTLGGILNPSSILKRASAKVLTGASAPAGQARKLSITSRGGTIAPAGAATRAVTRGIALAATLALSGVGKRLVALQRGGALNPTGTSARAWLYRLTGAVSPSAVILVIRLRFVSFAGSLSPAAALGRVKVIPKLLGGSLAPSATVVRSTAKFLVGFLQLAGLVLKVHFVGTATMADITVDNRVQALMIVSHLRQIDLEVQNQPMGAVNNLRQVDLEVRNNPMVAVMIGD